jgi:carbonic anhydrase/acetyltransferase-like protein (isoleucine patch superfamily)
VIYRLGDRRVTLEGDAFVAANATVVGSVLLKHQASVWFGSIVRGDSDLITIGEASNIQDGSVLHTDADIRLTLGRKVSVGHMVMLHGCTIGDGCLIGIRSVIMNHAVIGRHCLVGAGTLIPEGKSYPDGVLILGTPGRVVRHLSPEEIASLEKNADHYVERIYQYRASFAADGCAD